MMDQSKVPSDSVDHAPNKPEKPPPMTFSELPIILPELIRTDRARLRKELADFYQCLLLEWQGYIDDNSERLRETHEGRLTLYAQTSSSSMMKPLFKRLSKDQLDRDILMALAHIAACLQQRDYVRANDFYLKMAIGNAPWPIGVTAVGIHERTSRERIKSSQVAHVLNDEVSRKWIQTIKRFITHCQRVRPPSDPSKAMG